MGRRVVVTGMGVVSPIGADVKSYWEGLSSGACGVVRRTFSVDEELSITLPCAPVDGLEERFAAQGRDTARADRVSQLAVAAADEAIENAGLDIAGENAGRAACIMGAGIGGQTTFDQAYIGMLRKGRRPHPLSILRIIPNAPASHMSIRYGLKGPAFAISSACASGAHAIGVAADLIRNDGADIALAGASEAILTYGAMEAWRAMHILADETCRPFSKNRNGLVIGEGAAVLVLEEEERARARGAEIVARVAGFGMNADGKDMINPAMEGAAAAMRGALDGVRVDSPGAVYINAHGTGTLMNDPTETAAIRAVFGPGADALIVSSTKSMHGHLLGAAGGVEAVASLLALTQGAAPPTINYDQPDPDCDLNYAPNEAIERKFDIAVSNSFAFGGLNAVVAFERV